MVAALLKRGSGASQWISRIALGFILGGAIGNLYDRVFRGMVTDFVEIYNGGWSFPAFNVADSAITIGAVFLLFELIGRNGIDLPDMLFIPLRSPDVS